MYARANHIHFGRAWALLACIATAWVLSTPLHADNFVWDGGCATENWHGNCPAGGSCTSNNWNRTICGGGSPPLPGPADNADIGNNVVRLLGGNDVNVAGLTVGPGGELHWQSNAMNVANGDSLGTVFFEGGSPLVGFFRNRGTLISSAPLAFSNGALRNEGTLELRSANYSTPGTNLLDNAALCRKTTSSPFDCHVPTLNSGMIHVEQGVLTFTGRLQSDAGAMCVVDAGASLVLRNVVGQFDVSNAGTVTLFQFNILAPGAGFNVDGTGMTASGNSTMASGATLTNDADGILNFPTGFSIIGANSTLTNLGQVNYSTPGTFTGMTINNIGTWTISGSFPNFSSGGGTQVFNNSGTAALNHTGTFASIVPWTNSGSVQLNSGSFSVNLNQTAGQLVLAGGNHSAGTLTLGGGELRGAGSVATLANNVGLVKPGASAGTLTAASYSQAAGGTLEIEIGGTAAGTQHDRLAVSGTAALGGTLAVTLINGFVPQSSNTFTILTCSSRTGSFANAVPSGNVGTLTTPQGTFTVTYNSNSVVLSGFIASAPCVGDLDDDDAVGLSDLSILLSHFGMGSGATLADGDLDDDDDVDISDLAILLARFGSTCP